MTLEDMKMIIRGSFNCPRVPKAGMRPCVSKILGFHSLKNLGIPFPRIMRFLHMTSEGMGVMSESDFADKCEENLQLC